MVSSFQIHNIHILENLSKFIDRYETLKETEKAFWDELSEFKEVLDIYKISEEIDYLYLFILNKCSEFFTPIFYEIKDIVKLLNYNYSPLMYDLGQLGIEINYHEIYKLENMENAKLEYNCDLNTFSMFTCNKELIISFSIDIVKNNINKLEFVLNEHKDYLKNGKIKDTYTSLDVHKGTSLTRKITI